MTPEEENVWRTLKDQIPLVTSFWCKFNIHKWTKWKTQKESSQYDAGKGNFTIVRQRRWCVHCDTINEQILKFKEN